VRISLSDVESAFEHFGEICIQSGPPLLESEDGNIPQVGELHHKSVFRYIEEGNATVYGSLPGFRGGNKSKVVDTHIRADVEEYGIECKTGKPVLVGYEPWRLGALDIVQQEFKIDDNVLSQCVQSFTDDILRSLPKSQLAELTILDDTSTLNGLPGVKFIDKMNRKTSMGYPWRTKKSNYLINMGSFDQWNDCVTFGPEFYERVNKIVDTYRQGQRVMPVFINHPKDEPTALHKIEAKKTRLFSGSPADWGFVVRKYLLSTVRVIQNNKYIFEAAPGTNATSLEWDNMYHYLTQHGKNQMVAGDYAKFDKRMSAQMVLSAFTVLENILRKAGWPEDDLLIIHGIACDTSFPLSDFNGDLVEFWGSNPSGHPLTVIINSIVNSLYLRYTWCKMDLPMEDFKTKVSLMTYGDDNIMGVSRTVPQFNHTSIQTELAKIGVKYTMADKEAESVPYISISEVSFLKRKWIYKAEVGSHVAQIEFDTIQKMLTKCLPSKVISMEAHAIEVMNCALREFFFYDKETFQLWRGRFLAIVKKRGLEAEYELAPFPVYEELIEGYLEVSKDWSENGRCSECEKLH
jgi:hypothetical protein